MLSTYHSQCAYPLVSGSPSWWQARSPRNYRSVLRWAIDAAVPLSHHWIAPHMLDERQVVSRRSASCENKWRLGMDLFFWLILGILVACCVIPMFFMGKHGRKKSDDKSDDGSNNA